MLSVRDMRVASYDLDYLDIFWEISPTFDDVHDYTFTVERSTATLGPYEHLAGPFSDKYHLKDTTVKGQHSFYTKFYYRLKIVRLSDSKTTYFPADGEGGVSLGAAPDLMALEMARITRYKLKEHAGRELWIYPRKRTGQRCSCYDVTMSRKMRTGCLTCYDTSWVGGYDTPFKVWGNVFDPTEATMKTHVGEFNNENTMVRLPNFPEVFPGWVIIEAENIRWRVGNQNNTSNKTEKGRALIRQDMPIHRIPKGDIEYSLPVVVDDLSNVQASPPRNFTNPQNKTVDRTLDSALSFFMKD